jgi:hypothetical protein
VAAVHDAEQAFLKASLTRLPGVQPPATFRLNELSVKLLVERGDTAALRACADAGNWQAREPLVKLLVERGDIDALRAYADAGESWALHRLVDVLAERGDFEALRARADAGDSHAAGRLAERGDFDALSRPVRRHRRARLRPPPFHVGRIKVSA